MRRIAPTALFAGFALLVLVACGLLAPGRSTTDQPELCCDGSLTAPPGTEAHFDMTLSNPSDAPIQTHVVMRSQTPGDWRIALCYSELSAAGRGEAEMDLELAAGETLDVQAKFFVPADAQPGQQATATVAVGGAESVSLALDIVAE
jgi:uncharacterized membrane protein